MHRPPLLLNVDAVITCLPCGSVDEFAASGIDTQENLVEAIEELKGLLGAKKPEKARDRRGLGI